MATARTKKDSAERLPATPRAQEAVRRALAARESAYADEVQRLLDAGLEIIRTTEAMPRVSDIVHKAGLSNAAFYRHFPSKDDLVAAVGQTEGGGHAGQAAAYDHGTRRHARPTDSARAATRSFSVVGSDRRPCRTSAGWASMRPRRRR